MRTYTARTFVQELLMIGVAIVWMVPIYLLVVTAFKGPSDLSDSWVPSTSPTLQNFKDAWQIAALGPALMNSLMVVLGSLVILIAASSLAAYPLARVTRRWSKGAYVGFMLGLMLPIQLSLIPVFFGMKSIGLTGTVPGLIFVYAGVQMPFCIFLYTEFLRSVPRDYDEAAQLDGANHFKTFVHVLFPMLRPCTGTVVILNAVFIWNDFYMPVLYLSGTTNQTLPVAVYSFVGQYTTNWNLIFAGLILSALPILVLFLLMQKAVFRGFSAGLKG